MTFKLTKKVNIIENILIFCEGFTLYGLICHYLGVKTRYYDLMGDKNWEMNLNQVEELIDDDTKCIVVTNPSNPCGKRKVEIYSFD